MLNSKIIAEYDHIYEKLSNIDEMPKNLSGLTIAAVIIILVPRKSGTSIIMTSRSKKLNNHPGQMSFPGGKFDPDLDKSLQDTALRETQEEIGLLPKEIQILGHQKDFFNRTGFLIRPFVGYHKNPDSIKYIQNNSEVEEIVEIPLNFLLNISKFEETLFLIGEKRVHSVYFNYLKPSNGHKFKIWGVSARILADFLIKIYDHKIFLPN